MQPASGNSEIGLRKSTPVDFLLENRTRLEGEDLPGGDSDGFASLGIAAFPVLLLVHDEFAETGNLNLFSGRQSFLDDLQDGFYEFFGFFPRNNTTGTDVFDEFFFGHGKNFYHENTRKAI